MKEIKEGSVYIHKDSLEKFLVIYVGMILVSYKKIDTNTEGYMPKSYFRKNLIENVH